MSKKHTKKSSAAEKKSSSDKDNLLTEGFITNFFKAAKQNKATDLSPEAESTSTLEAHSANSQNSEEVSMADFSAEQIEAAERLAGISGKSVAEILAEFKAQEQKTNTSSSSSSSSSFSTLSSASSTSENEKNPLVNEEPTSDADSPKKRSRFRKPKIDDYLLDLVAQREAEQLAEQQARAESNAEPTYFEDFLLESQLLKNLHQQNYFRATDIQAKCIPLALNGQDVFGTAATGTGKTLAFLVPAIQYLFDVNSRNNRNNKECSVLVVAPTKDLVLQIYYEAEYLLEGTPFNVDYLLGKSENESYTPEEATEKFSQNQIIIATPGRLANELKEGKLYAGSVKILVLDEADRILEIGLGEDLRTIHQHTKARRNSLLFSATPDAKVVNFFKEIASNNPVMVEASHSRSEKRKITQYYYHADSFEHKLDLLSAIIKDQNLDRTMVFVKKKENIPQVYKHILRHSGMKVTRIDGDMDKDARQRAIGLFDQGKVQVIVTTDLLSRGIDIEKVKAVINFDIPYDADTFVHRIGRTGRIGEKGLAISLVEAHDYVHLGKVMRYLREIIPARIHPGFEPQTSVAANALSPRPSQKDKEGKGKSKNKTEKKSKAKDKPKAKERTRDKKNKGFPKKFLAKKQAEFN